MSSDYSYFNRELSWLSFNQRVLDEAKDESVPLYERIKFLAIYSSNLDEFFRVKVASLQNMMQIKSEKIKKLIEFDPEETLQQIAVVTFKQQREFGRIFTESVIPKLKENKIILYSGEEILPNHYDEIRHYFNTKILSYLQPIFIDETEKKYFLENR